MSPFIKKLVKQGFKIAIEPPIEPKPRAPRGFCMPKDNVAAAVDAYLRIRVRERGDGARIARKFNVPLSSLLTQVKRRAKRGEAIYPKIYADRS